MPDLAARLTEHPPAGSERGTALLLHGAGTTTGTPLDLAIADALTAVGVRVVRLDQPYTLGRRRPPAPAAQLDAVVTGAAGELGRPLVLLGRSSGARVACRVASAIGAVGILALGFPLVPPGRPGKSRAGELAAAGVPVVVVQGSRDTFGGPAEIAELALPGVTVHAVVGADHGFGVRRSDGRSVAGIADEVAGVAVAAVAGWI